MKKIIPFFLGFILILLADVCTAQKLEVSAGISGNLSNYGGTDAITDGFYSNTMVLSKKLTGGYGANAQLKVVTKAGFILGVQSGYDVLRSTAPIKSMIVYNSCIGCLVAPMPSSDGSTYGYATNTTKFVNLNPFLGYRFKKNKLAVDLTLGTDFAFVAEDKNHMVNTSYYSSDQTTYFDRSKLSYVTYSKTDVRIKTGVGFWYDRFGLDINYEHGLNDLTNHPPAKPYYYSPGSAFSQVLRLGLNYRLL